MSGVEMRVPGSVLPRSAERALAESRAWLHQHGPAPDGAPEPAGAAALP